MAEGAIVRTLRVLRVLCESGPLTLKEVSEQTGLVSPTALRTLRLMAEEGFVVQQPDRTWRATMLMWRLGYLVNASLGAVQLAGRYTDRLQRELHETTVYAVLDEDSVTYAAHSEPQSPVRAHVRLGSRHGLLSVATGRVILAWLDHQQVQHVVAAARPEDGGEAEESGDLDTLLSQVRRQGYYSGPGLQWPDLWGVAAAVFDATGQPVGALGVSIPVSRIEECEQAAIEAVMREANALTKEMGGRWPGPVTTA
ncbi:IclR family transcriptional regulator [Streptomyces sp. CWNU-52B]|uniref:IclR family transcriptional regulator n=1 Tax=unclassified Streptomyces TaxID=2593676 RepID=UPI0039BF90BF